MFIVLTKNEILTNLYLNNEVDELINKIKPEDLRDDLKQYAFAVLCEKPEEFIIDLNNKKQLKYFLVKIISNSIFSNRSGFLTQHKNSKELLIDIIPDIIDNDDNYHDMIDKCIDESSKIYWYNQELLQLYSIHGTYREVSRITNIPVKSVHNAVKKAKEQIKQNIWK